MKLPQPLIQFFRFLNRKDMEISMNRPERWELRFPRLEQLFYPRNKGRGIAVADRFMAPIILFACLAAVWEFVAQPGSERTFFFLTVFFLTVFALEFLTRVYLRAGRYFFVWGWIDLFVVLVDTLAVVVFLSVIYDFDIPGIPYGEAGPFLRIVRLFRLARFAKLVVVFKDFEHLKRAFLRVAPFLKAGAGAFLVAGFLISAAVLVSNAFFDSTLEKSFSQIWSLVRSGLEVGEIESNATNADVLVFLYQATAVLIVLGTTTIITQIFTSLLARYSSPEEAEIIGGLRGHLVIALNDEREFGILEEVLEVFVGYLGQEAVILAGAGDIQEMQLLATPKIHVVAGEIGDPSAWKRANIANAGCVVNLGTSGLRDGDIRTLMLSTTGDTSAQDFTVFNIQSDASYRRISDGQTPSVHIVDVPLGALLDALELALWDTESIGFELMRRKFDALDDEMEIPEPGMPELRNAADLKALVQAFEHSFRDAGVEGVEIDEDGRNVRVRMSADTEEAAEVSMISVLDAISGSNGVDTHGAAVFVYVRSFPLVNWNTVFQSTGRGEYHVFAIELGAVFAIHHELCAPYSMMGWLIAGPSDEFTMSVFDLGSGAKKRFRSRAEVLEIVNQQADLPEAAGVLAVRGGQYRGADEKVRVFLDEHTDRRRCGGNSKVYVAHRV